MNVSRRFKNRLSRDERTFWPNLGHSNTLRSITKRRRREKIGYFRCFLGISPLLGTGTVPCRTPPLGRGVGVRSYVYKHLTGFSYVYKPYGRMDCVDSPRYSVYSVTPRKKLGKISKKIRFFFLNLSDTESDDAL